MRASTSLLALALAACAPSGPREVVLHDDECAYCRMEVADARYAAEVLTRTGRLHVFDAPGCMVEYVRAAAPGSLEHMWVTDFERPGTFLPAAGASYLADGDLRGPMGSIAAFASEDAARVAQRRAGGRVISWPELLADSAARTASGVH